jgi:hypothetical protein
LSDAPRTLSTGLHQSDPCLRDLIDVQLLKARNPDLSAVRDACERVFAVRGQHAWQPTVTVQASWPAAYRVLADGLGFPVNDAADAVRAIQQFEVRVAAA